MTRMYKKGSSDSSESEEDQDETDNSNFEETLYKSVAEAVAPVKRQPSDHDDYFCASSKTKYTFIDFIDFLSIKDLLFLSFVDKNQNR